MLPTDYTDFRRLNNANLLYRRSVTADPNNFGARRAPLQLGTGNLQRQFAQLGDEFGKKPFVAARIFHWLVCHFARVRLACWVRRPPFQRSKSSHVRNFTMKPRGRCGSNIFASRSSFAPSA